MFIKLAIVDSNSAYLNNFESYISKSRIKGFEIAIFTEFGYFENYLMHNTVDAVLVVPEFYEAVSTAFSGPIIVLHEGDTSGFPEGIDSIIRYENIGQIISKVTSLTEDARRINDGPVKRTEIISFYSPIGGSGKTTLSLITAKLMALHEKQVLYIPLEFFSNLREYMANNNNKDYTYMFCCEGDDVDFKSDLDKVINIDSHTGLHYFNGAFNYIDLVEIDIEEWNMMFNRLKGIGLYDYIILDLQTELNERTMNLMNNSFKTVIVGAAGSTEGIKFNTFYNVFKNKIDEFAFNEKDNFILVVNNAKNVSSGISMKKTGFDECGELDFDSQFKYVENGLLNFRLDSALADQLGYLIAKITGRE